MKIIWQFCFIGILLFPGCSPGRPASSADMSAERNPRAEILAQLEKAGGLMYVYDYTAEPEMTPAPKGYKPFYISHFGRHGARYAMKSQYKMVYQALTQADAALLLTERGKQFLKDYGPFYEEAIYHDGELSRVGIEQERTLAARMVRRFPEVFKGNTRLSALATPVGRVILSMTSFIDGLQGIDKTLEVEENGSESFSPILRPNWSPLSEGRSDTIDEISAPYIPYFKETVDIKGILGRIFTDPAAAVSRLGIDEVPFIRNLFDIVNGMQCLEEPAPFFDDILTLEDQVAIARASAYRISLFLGRYKDSGSLYADYAAYTLQDILDKAEADMASGEYQLRLRFSHDSSVLPVAVFMDLNGLGRTAESPEEAFAISPLWEMPMGGNLQLVFYRSARHPDILVKALWNEQESVLPFPAAEGPYYRWNDFKAYYREAMDTSFAKIQSAKHHAND